MGPAQTAVVFAAEARAAALRAHVPLPCVCVRSRAEFTLALAQPHAVTFVDVDLMQQVDGLITTKPIVAIVDDGAGVGAMVRALGSCTWLGHVISAGLLLGPDAAGHLRALVDRFTGGLDASMLDGHGIGRMARLAHASRREARFGRIDEFFHEQGIAGRSAAALHEAAEELVMNALYDAPYEAGYFEHPIPRTEAVQLPADRGCEISYGIDRGHPFVRVRDPFGALSRARIVDVLTRCAGASVTLDESRGGAGLGLWRIFSTASTLSISVVPGQLTDVTVRFAISGGKLAKQPLALHLFFAPRPPDLPDRLVDYLLDHLLEESRSGFDLSVALPPPA